jgi:hypothetical protein
MMFLMTLPMVRDCCLPATHHLPCHESKKTDDATCFSSQQAIAETKTTFGISSSIDYQCPVADVAKSAITTQIRRSPNRVTLVTTPTDDIYLRIGALLI